MLNFLLEVTLYGGIFCLVYTLLLRRQSIFVVNRGYFIVIAIGSLSIISCKDKQVLEETEKQEITSSSSKDVTEICDWVEEIIIKDQYYRELLGMNPSYIRKLVILDSLIVAANLSNDEFQALTVAEQTPIKEQTAAIANTHKEFPKAVQDSIWKLQVAIDIDNTKQVLQKLYEIDYPKLNDFECFEKSLLVFVHTPSEAALLEEEVKQAVEARKEFIDPGQYRHIMWNLNGRKGEIH